MSPRLDLISELELALLGMDFQRLLQPRLAFKFAYFNEPTCSFTYNSQGNLQRFPKDSQWPAQLFLAIICRSLEEHF